MDIYERALTAQQQSLCTRVSLEPTDPLSRRTAVQGLTTGTATRGCTSVRFTDPTSIISHCL